MATDAMKQKRMQIVRTSMEPKDPIGSSVNAKDRRARIADMTTTE